uniref:Uncharacterized protein n=1 Tax=Ciona savignyi TaxID=51511 RepID=H2ZQX2_CIOSA
MYEANWTMTNHCLQRHHRAVTSVFAREVVKTIENDVILEYKTFKKIYNVTGWNFEDCNSESCKRVLFSDANTTSQNTTNLETRNATSSVTTAIKTVSYEIRLLNCSEMAKYFEDPVTSQFKQLDPGPVKSAQGISQMHGMIVQAGGKKKYVISSMATQNTTGYKRLHQQYLKHMDLGFRMRGIPDLYGACITDQQIQLMTRFAMGQKLCNPERTIQSNYSNTDCYKLSKLEKLLEGRRDKVKPMLTFMKSMICLLARLEEKKYFLHDIHGQQFSLNPDMSVVINDMENVFRHGERNIYGGSICIEDDHCPTPSGVKWKNGTANHVVYSSCRDATANCVENKCAGFNASLHLCGIIRWVTPLVFRSMTKLKERIKLVHIMALVSNRHPRLRSSGKEACDQITEALSDYKYNPDKPSGFHVGRPNSNHR